VEHGKENISRAQHEILAFFDNHVFHHDGHGGKGGSPSGSPKHGSRSGSPNKAKVVLKWNNLLKFRICCKKDLNKK
jgi:hypothetical protein